MAGTNRYPVGLKLKNVCNVIKFAVTKIYTLSYQLHQTKKTADIHFWVKCGLLKHQRSTANERRKYDMYAQGKQRVSKHCTFAGPLDLDKIHYWILYQMFEKEKLREIPWYVTCIKANLIIFHIFFFNHLKKNIYSNLVSFWRKSRHNKFLSLSGYTVNLHITVTKLARLCYLMINTATDNC